MAQMGFQWIFWEIMTYDVVYDEGSERESQFCWVSSMVYCFTIDCKNDSNKTKGTSCQPFPKDHL